LEVARTKQDSKKDLPVHQDSRHLLLVNTEDGSSPVHLLEEFATKKKRKKKKPDLARFGYRPDMKVEKRNRILLYSWLLTGTYYKSLVIWKPFFFSKSGKNFTFSFLIFWQQKTFQILFYFEFFWNLAFWRNFPRKKKKNKEE
jgi:hypothetical protein